ncbi:putative N-acetylmannosamine-6-phosphate 2-epimerase [Fimbriimonas ginsengisoli]|uniref:N-acylglucosamine-6-phosphate 2-epimerase n=1 Tax=Fimbriimonas ginsengisoli Gsoil 348 TaxID=661478 RepID=A0A068NSB3_FIMGI|nr:putative N-acetylmannosamine-6-phosphate 2-epimerase [Fimbriimonas ginsengisoli]AIE85640.1 N-acetylmannosamine-6-phosphate 2-epimerase [Fimbriimonas ginsengisoli Gsoil 348]
MTLDDLLTLLHGCPLVASVQASEGSPVDDPETLLKLARASTLAGVRLLRLQGARNIRAIRRGTGVPVIGLIKRTYPDSDVYITPTIWEVDEVIDEGAEVVALDATARHRSGDALLGDLIAHAHSREALVLADIDTVENAVAAVAAGADMVSTTLGGYTSERAATTGADLELLRQTIAAVTVPVFAEGRYAHRWEIDAALRIGAAGVIVGGALNDPVKQTRALMPVRFEGDKVGAVDIGGTWLRFGTFTSDWKLIEVERTPNPPKREERLQWIRDRIQASGVHRVGVSTGGIVDPRTGLVWKAKEYLMADHVGIVFSEETLGIPTFAIGDGHATAWGHANLPRFAGRRVATLAIGTGLGAGFVQEGKIWAGRRGEYPRVNDLPAPGGKTYEELLGGIHITKEPTQEAEARAILALESALKAVSDLYFPDDIVIAGSVGLSPWLAPHLHRLGAIPSPFDHDAGLYGAAAVALFPPPL